MITINPYLNFNGNTEEAFNFYKNVFGGELSIYRFRDTPEVEKVSEKDKDRIMHISLPVGNGNTLMASDAMESMGRKHEQGNNFYISVKTETEEDAKRIFNELSEGGKVEMDFQKSFWSSGFGMVRDKFGIQWMIDYSTEENNS